MGTKKILVEGSHDKRVLLKLGISDDAHENLRVEEHNGISSLRKTLPVQIKESDLDVLGVVIDGNQDPAGRWQSISAVLRRAGYPGIPRRLPAGGLILAPPRMPRFGLWMMPDNGATGGYLEDFLLDLVPADDETLAYVQQCMQDMPHRARKFKAAASSKAEVHGWLAWHKSPGQSLWGAIGSGYFDTDRSPATDFIDWANRLLT